MTIRCPECGSWDACCISDTPVSGCGCARCLAAENAALRVQIGKDCGDFDYPPGSAPCMCYFSTAEDRGPDPIGECHYHASLRKDAEARSLYDRTAAAQGFTNAPHWNDLAEETRQMYRDERAKRDAAMGESHAE